MHCASELYGDWLAGCREHCRSAARCSRWSHFTARTEDQARSANVSGLRQVHLGSYRPSIGLSECLLYVIDNRRLSIGPRSYLSK